MSARLCVGLFWSGNSREKRKNRRNDRGEKRKRRTVARQVGEVKVKHAAYRRWGLAACSKWLFAWPQIEFVGPSASGLTMQRPIGVGDSVDGKQAALPLGANIVGEVRCG